MNATRCSHVSGCKEPTASETFPDLVNPDGLPVNYTRCVAHELERMREGIARLTYFESQLTMASLTRPDFVAPSTSGATR